MVKFDYLVRRGLPGEFVSIAALSVRAWETSVGIDFLSDERRSAMEENFLGYLHENADGVLVAERDGIACGWGARIPKSNYIADLWIDPPYQGQGIGTGLLDALMAQILLDGFSEAEIGTHADNFRAIRLYEKMGFRIEWRGSEMSVSLGRDVEKVRMQAKL
ncbi:ribosomal-protein-alanine N-acetyltransferase [Ochrobactrum daejeonense]|uniref:Ribosomal-protein-alanine N-acetyltransferase n=1 Tax=Brucella daejeonensis TaxID=659015 RepID=A0A7W9AYY1_9HYPH|nr:GNAT family N-acetyltransferase [Brucella daejeonensis]MBB5702754.1 ribosomal-protein-alanine N-acetyltransferase [Brucella daejeonensis]